MCRTCAVYGETEKPAAGYDKRTMANDVIALMQHCGVSKAAIVGHDRGARVATRLAKDYPDAMDRLVVMDNIPTRIIFERMNAEIARGHWFFIFNNVPDLPEALIAGREEIWLRFIFSSWCYNPELFTAEEMAAYVRAYSQPGALRGAFSDYRAGQEDVAQDEADKETLIQCPTLALWGEDFALGGKMWDFREVWSKMAVIWSISLFRSAGICRMKKSRMWSLVNCSGFWVRGEVEPGAPVNESVAVDGNGPRLWVLSFVSWVAILTT